MAEISLMYGQKFYIFLIDSCHLFCFVLQVCQCITMQLFSLSCLYKTQLRVLFSLRVGMCLIILYFFELSSPAFLFAHVSF